jgi:hypothetical protein
MKFASVMYQIESPSDELFKVSEGDKNAANLKVGTSCSAKSVSVCDGYPVESIFLDGHFD